MKSQEILLFIIVALVLLIGLVIAVEFSEHRPQNPVSDQPKYSIPTDVT